MALVVVGELPRRIFVSIFEQGALEAVIEEGGAMVAGAVGGDDEGEEGEGGAGVGDLEEAGDAEEARVTAPARWGRRRPRGSMLLADAGGGVARGLRTLRQRPARGTASVRG